MELSVVQQAQEILASELAINLKVTKVLDLLNKESCAYYQVLQPAQCLIHRANRGGLMCNPWDMLRVGILQEGPDMSKIKRSVALEIGSKDQVTKNAELVSLGAPNSQRSDGEKTHYGHDIMISCNKQIEQSLQKAPTTCTVTTSHLVCFCSARTEHTEQALLAAIAQPVGNPFRKQWSTRVRQGCGEMEAMRSLAEVFTLASNTGSPSWQGLRSTSEKLPGLPGMP